MLSDAVFDAFSSNLVAEGQVHKDNREGNKRLYSYMQCSENRTFRDLLKNLGLRMMGEPVIEPENLERYRLLLATMVQKYQLKEPVRLDLESRLAFTEAYSGQRRGESEARRLYAKSVDLQLRSLGMKEKNEPAEATLQKGSFLPKILQAYAHDVGPDAAKDDELRRGLTKAEALHAKVLAGYDAQIKQFKEKALHLVLIDTTRRVAEGLQQASAPMREGASQVAQIVPSPVLSTFGCSHVAQATRASAQIEGASSAMAQADGVMAEVEGLSDLDASPIEKIRHFDNGIRAMQLELALTQVHLGDLDGAERRLSATEPFGAALDYNRFVSPVISYEWYVSARLALARGNKAAAKAAYDRAIDYLYLAPRSRWRLYESSTSLLAEAAVMALQDGSALEALHYSDLARQVNAGSPSLYHFLPSDELERRVAALNAEFRELREQARAEAERLNQAGDFEFVDKRLDRRLKLSIRAAESPIAPLFVGLVQILPWLESGRMNAFVRQMEVLAALWENRASARYRAAFLTEEAKRSLGTFELGGDDAWGKEALTSMFKGPASGSAKTPAEVEVAQRAIPADTTLLSLWLAPESLIVVVADRARAEGRALPLRENGLMMLAEDVDLGSEAAQKDLHSKIIQPVEALLKERVVILTDGPLRRMPLATLRSAASDAYFGDAHILRYLPSLNYLMHPPRPASRRKPRSVVLAPWDVVRGRPLEQAKVEAQAVRKRFPGKMLTSQKVTRRSVGTHLGGAPVLHFAGHAVVEQNLPDFTRMIVGDGESGAEGFFVHDIKATPLDDVRLAVLSACTTGAGPKITGQGFSSLSAAFLFSGAEAVVSSIERVDDDQTRILMGHFYEGLSRGMAKDEALREAQQRVRAMSAGQKGWSTSGWAAFALSGDPRPIFRR